MNKLLRKEFSLAMHPTVPLMMLLAPIVLIPNYPYTVVMFYTTMGIFFTCLSGRENNDIIYSLNLPVAKKDIVKARFIYAVILELIQLTLMIPFAVINHNINSAGNQAGMDANISLFALGFIVYGIFNLVFFSSYYKNVNKVGSSFLKSSIAVFAVTAAEVISTYAVPFVKNVLDTADPQFLMQKLIFLLAGAAIFLFLTFISYRRSVTVFEKQDLNQ